MGCPSCGWDEQLNIVLISHCDFTGNSALHAYNIATELQRRGVSPAIVVPANPNSVRDIGVPSFPILTYRDARKGRLRFPDAGRADLIHTFTPRERVRELTVQLAHDHRCPYIVHLEDNEEAILALEAGGMTSEAVRRLPARPLDRAVGQRLAHPARAQRFLEQAAGVTAVIDRLLEFKPPQTPGIVAWPGFDEQVPAPARLRERVCTELGLRGDEIVVVYTGNINEVNVHEMRSFYLALAALRRNHYPVVLVKTGWNSVRTSALPNLGAGIRDLGWVARKRVPELIAAADVLVQPGRPDAVNDYRFPAKLPDFLASGRPVVLPRANIGRHLENGTEAIVMKRGDAEDIYESVALLATNPELGARLGERGRAFAQDRLRWRRSVDEIEGLYSRVLAGLPIQPREAASTDRS